MKKHFVTSKGVKIEIIKEEKDKLKSPNREDLQRVIEEILKNHNINNQIKLEFKD